ncbi:hypothetical protein H4582DRAFT_2001367 [Lactarius indigo]|nr:hypothetical protein H4582DRAFT_2001367 [Lactarius indigo]
MVLGILASWEDWLAAKRAKARSDKIDRQIEEDAKFFKRTRNVLLMGLNDPDTSAIVRQMKIVHQNGYSREELLEFRPSIWSYLLEISRRIVQDLQNSGLELTTYTNKVRISYPTFRRRTL